MTLAQHVADTIEVIEHLRRKLSKQRVVLLGYSWGSSIGVHVAAQHPDLLSAYVGTGQVTSQAAEAILHAEALAAAQRCDNAAAVAALRALAPYPGPDGTASLDQTIKVRGIAARYDALWYGQADRRLLREVPYFAPQYTDEDVELFVQGSRWMQESVLKRRPGDVPEAARVVDQFAVPVVVLQGTYDLYTPWAAAKTWFDSIQAPHKAFVTLHRSSHTAFIEEPGRFLVALIEQVLPLTEGSPDHAPAPRAWRTE